MIIVPPMFTVPKVLYVVPSPLNWRPCITAFGSRFPLRRVYPSKVHRYKPLSLPTLQSRASAAAGCAVADVPGAIVAAKHTNAQATARELIIVFVNFVFIIIVSFCLSFLVLTFFDSHHGSHFWPFTGVQNGNQCEVMLKVGFATLRHYGGATTDSADFTDIGQTKVELTNANGDDTLG